MHVVIKASGKLLCTYLSLHAYLTKQLQPAYIMTNSQCETVPFWPLAIIKLLFIIFLKSRNTFQYPLSKRVCKRLSKRLSRVVARKALSLRSLIHRHVPSRRSVGDVKPFQNNCAFIISTVSSSNTYQITLFSAFQKGVINPLIKTALRLSSAKITLKVVWKPKFYTRKVMINAPNDVQ